MGDRGQQKCSLSALGSEVSVTYMLDMEDGV